ncbi:hypothetical protein ACFQGA_08545 [Marinobacter koreensis]|uniref:Uncharacterized protein n=1 Tax=Marinobacter koreensis TaxID=335974 RepID=A0ABW0RI23_9GAMM|nr:hypothetical protein [Marinobacter koreensis]MCK7547005.1 hypothetical protein [Marinobacter koreensis]
MQLKQGWLHNGIFEEVLMNGGPHSVTVKITDSNGESTSRDLSFQLDTLSTLEVITRIDTKTRQLCADTPLECGIDTDAIRQDGYNTGYQVATEDCTADPEACGVDLSPYLEQGKQLCIEDPTGNCGIAVQDGAFDSTLIPNMGAAWKLYGTGQDITDPSTVFAGASIGWARQNNEWREW